MDIQELKPIIDLMNAQEERLVKKIDNLHTDVKIINSTVAKHEKSINLNSPYFSFDGMRKYRITRHRER